MSNSPCRPSDASDEAIIMVQEGKIAFANEAAGRLTHSPDGVAGLIGRPNPVVMEASGRFLLRRCEINTDTVVQEVPIVC